MQLVKDREPYEHALSPDNTPQAYLSYIQFELKEKKPARAKLLYEVALLNPQADINLWISYINFVSKELRDTVSARATFERCRHML